MLVEDDGRYAFGMVTAQRDGVALEVRLFDGIGQIRHRWDRLHVLPAEVDGSLMSRAYMRDAELPTWRTDLEDCREFARRFK